MGNRYFIPLNEVEKHNNENDCWVIVNGKVYDVTIFLDKHPAGKYIIINNSGKDISLHLFFHSKFAKNILKKYFIGYLKKV